MKLISWNVNGIRAVAEKGLFDYLQGESPDIFCIQETKADEGQLDASLLSPDGYQTYWNSSQERKGYSGVAIFSKRKPKSVKRGTEVLTRDTEGRILLAEYDDFVLYNIYFPNGGRGDERLRYKLEFYDEILEHFERLRESQSLVICGDVNTAHNPIDLANPKQNETNSGFLPEERAWLDRLFSLGYVDTFRFFHPRDRDRYSWWDMRTFARERNAGWRIDYFIVSPDLTPRLKKAAIHMDVMGSDHAPVVLELL